MKKLVIFDDWTIDEDTPFGSGASKKNWLVSQDNAQRGIFKYPKVTSSGKITGEYWAECLACEIAQSLYIPCAKVDIGVYRGQIGSMSYMLLKKGEALIEGVSYISKEYPSYNPDDFFDASTQEWYSIQMIMKSMKDIGLDKDCLMFPIFDALIGNTDRHHSNWGVVTGENCMKLSPLYDNGSSLCSIVPEEKINIADKHWFSSLIGTRSRSLIRFENIKAKPTHFEMMKFLAENYLLECIYYVNRIRDTLTNEKIDALIGEYPDDIISPAMKVLLSLFLKERRNKIIEIFERN